MLRIVQLPQESLPIALLTLCVALAFGNAPRHAQAESAAEPSARTLLTYRRGDQTTPTAPSATKPPALKRPAGVSPQQTPPRFNRDAQSQAVSRAQVARAQEPAAAVEPEQSQAAGETRRLSSQFNPAHNSPGNNNLQNSKTPLAFPAGKLLSTAGAGLAIVVGLFLACMWLLRSGGKTPNGVLPSEAFAVLGRAPLFGRTTAQLLRLGNKLVLVAVSPEGLQPIVEVTDPVEVDRLAGLCQGGSGASSTAEFQQMLRKLANEPASGFLGREAT